MGRPRFRRASGVALTLPAAFAALLALGPNVHAAASPLAITTTFGYGNAVKLGDWMPLDVAVTNTGPAFDGTLQVESASGSLAAKGGPPGTSNVVYQAALNLATGATKHLRTYVLQEQVAPITIQAVEGGRVVSSADAPTTNTLDVLVGVVSDQPSTLSALAGSAPQGWTPGVIHLAAADLPDSAVLLRAFDLVAVDDFSTDTLTAAQRAALQDYVLNGGSLLIGTGGSWHKTLAGLPSSIVPMRIDSSIVVNGSTALQGVIGLEVATGATVDGARAWFSDGGRPLIVEEPVGSGLVTLAAFDWNQQAIAGWSGTPDVLRQLLVRSALGTAAAANAGSFGGPFGTSISSRGGSVSQVLSSLPGLDLPSFWVIGVLIAVYVLMVGPINYLVLRRINRRALAWITLPVIVLVTSAGAYGASVATKGQSILANEVAILHVQPGSGSSYQEAYTSIITPARGDYRIDVAGTSTQIAPIDYYNYSGPGPGSTDTMSVDTASNTITLNGVTAFSPRGFATERYTTGPTLDVHLQLSHGQLTGTVTNTSSISFTDGVVLAGNAFQKFGALAPGQSASFGFVPTAGSPFVGPPAFMNVYPNAMYGGGGPAMSTTSDAEREAESKTAILSLLSTGVKGSSWSATPTVVAWTKQPFEDVSVDGGRPHVYAESAVVEKVPVFQISAGALPSGVALGRVIDMVGGVQPQGGPPGDIMLNSGSITYDFTPALTPGSRVGSAAIYSDNQFAGKGAPAAGGSAIDAQVWDWSKAAWVAVAFQQPGTTTIPASAVNPSTGEVQLKLSSDNSFVSGYLSLTGTVQ